MKKKLLALLLAATMVATAAGCSQNGGSGASSGADLAGVFLLAFPVIIFFMFTQRFFVQGIATSGIKS